MQHESDGLLQLDELGDGLALGLGTYSYLLELAQDTGVGDGQLVVHDDGGLDRELGVVEEAILGGQVGPDEVDEGHRVVGECFLNED